MILLWCVAAVAAGYQLLVIIAALRHLSRHDPVPRLLPPVSILKPVYGGDPHFAEAMRSHAVLDYPEYEVLIGIGRDDPARAEAERLAAEFPGRLKLVETHTHAANGKVGALIDLAAAARYPIWLVNDSDINVPPDYLRRLVGYLEDPEVGVVTCIYRPASEHTPGRWEALGISTDFAPSVLVARLIGVREFGLGATLLFRAQDLAAAGGFEALAEYLADDYQLARHITQLGRRVELARLVVETQPAGSSWSEVWRRQLRWARTIRVSRSGYIGLPMANASLWALTSLAAGAWQAAAGLLALRLLAGLMVGVGILKSREVARLALLIPFCDLWGFLVWLFGLWGNQVQWRGMRLRITPDGRIAERRPASAETFSFAKMG